MRMYDIILKKRNGGILGKEEIDYFIKNFTLGNIPDYQASALLMSIYFNNMTKSETIDLTVSMINSGNIMNLNKINGIKVDKHSTGGVGDKTTLVVGPMVAACGVSIAKMSGRGLGYTGGTIDKLESIKGFSTSIPEDDFIENVNTIGLAISSQTGNLVPADKKIYALRDVTATADCIPLIASSIMSKKIACGSDAILLDVKVGSGAFMKNNEDAYELAKLMVEIGTSMNKNTMAVISDMDQPLGYSVGNALEVSEAVNTLKGNGPSDLMELSLYLGSMMLLLSNKVKSIDDGITMINKTILNGSALYKFKQFVEAQGGDSSFIYNTNLLPQSVFKKELICKASGYICKISAEEVGNSSIILGAGRETKDSKIDLSAGIILHKKIGDYVKVDDILASIFGSDEIKMDICLKKLEGSFIILDRPPIKNPLIYGIVTKKGLEIFQNKKN